VPFIEAEGLTKSFVTGSGVRHVLDGAALSVARGEFVAIVGAMGCGKSTLISLLAGLTSPDSGEIRIDGEKVRGIRRDAALVFQNYSLLPWFSALENVRLAVSAAFPEWSKDRQRKKALQTLELVGLASAAHRRPSQLSGGMRQRVAIARAFAIDPTLLFLDEPFGALDALTRGSLQQELSRLCSSAERPVTVVMITNSVEEAILLADRIVPMTRGPRATLGAPIPVGLVRPRSAEQLAHDPQAVRVRAEIVGALTGGALPHARAGRAKAADASAPIRVSLTEPARES
jgi:nitrate/nitrite transport system ATP-binding protein